MLGVQPPFRKKSFEKILQDQAVSVLLEQFGENFAIKDLGDLHYFCIDTLCLILVDCRMHRYSMLDMFCLFIHVSMLSDP